MSLYLIGQSVIAVRPGRVTTMLHDGALIHAEPHDTNDYRATAEACGYGQDTERMNVEHEVVHLLLADLLGLPESPVMRAVANDDWQADPDGRLALEEAACLAIQHLAAAWGVNLLSLARSV